MQNTGDAWQASLSKRVGKAVYDRRKAIGLTALALSDRCAALGLPIHRTTITKIEKGRSRFDLGELLVLAAALDTSPVTLVYPSPYGEKVEVLPNFLESTFIATQWFSGHDHFVFDRDDYPDKQAADAALTLLNSMDADRWRAAVERLELVRLIDQTEAARGAAVMRTLREDTPENRQQIAFYDAQLAELAKQVDGGA